VNPAVQRQSRVHDKRQYVASGPLIDAMDTKQFARYLDKLRRQRPQFLEFLSHEPYARRSPKMHLSTSRPSAYEESALVQPKRSDRCSYKTISCNIRIPESPAIEQRPTQWRPLLRSYSKLTHFFTTSENLELLDRRARTGVGCHALVSRDGGEY